MERVAGPPLERTVIALTLFEKLRFFKSRSGNTRFDCDWSSDVCSSDLEDLNTKDNFANWAYATYIIYDTEKLVADADRAYAAETAKLAEEARRYEKLE